MQEITIKIIGETTCGMSFGTLIQAHFFEVQQTKTAGLALIAGSYAHLTGRTLDFFVNFIALRFPTERSESYMVQWAERLTAGTAWATADYESRSIMSKLAQEMKLKNIPDAWSERVTF